MYISRVCPINGLFLILIGAPKPVQSSWKYSTTGLFGPEAFKNLGLAEVDANLMTNLANLGLAHSIH